MRRLEEKEIAYIKNLIVYSDVKYYEVFHELLDHMIESTEQKLASEPQMSFEEAVKKSQLEFQPLGFNGIMEERRKNLRKETNRDTWLRYKSYWTWPKAVGSLGVFWTFFVALRVFAFKWIFLLIAMIILGVIAYNVFKTFKYWKKDGKRMLIIEQLNGYGLFLILYSSSFNIFTNGGFVEMTNYENLIVQVFFSFLFTSVLIHVHIYLKLHEQLLPEII